MTEAVGAIIGTIEIMEIIEILELKKIVTISREVLYT